MKKLSIVGIVLLAFILTGCGAKSSSTDATASATSTSTNSTASSQTKPYVPNQYDRMVIIDPVLYSYLSKGETNDLPSTTSTLSKKEQAKIGLQGNIRSSEKYGISGIATIVSAGQIQAKNFSFNGLCTPLQFYLIRSDQPEKPLIKVYELSSAASNSTFNIPILNTRLTSFDALGLYCADKPTKLISSVTFQ